MNAQKTRQSNATGGAPSTKAAAGAGTADRLSAKEAGAQGDAHAMNQAARAVMHPEGHEPEWRFYHGAVHG
jgi:hypothetical protein